MSVLTELQNMAASNQEPFSPTQFHWVWLYSLPSFLFFCSLFHSWELKFLFSIVFFFFFFFFFKFTHQYLYIFPARVSLMLPAAKNVLTHIKRNGALTINSSPSANNQYLQLQFCACMKPKNEYFKTKRQTRQSHFSPNITNLWKSPILMHLTNSHSRGANPTMVIKPLDGCQLHFLLRWNIPPLSNQLPPPPSQLLSFYLWTEPGAGDYGNIWPPTFHPPRRPCTPLSCRSPAITQSDDSLKGDPR